MKILIIVAALLLLFGLIYAWFWNGTIQEMDEMLTSTAGDNSPEAFKTTYPRLYSGLKMIGELDRLFAPSEDASASALEISQHIFRLAGRNVMIGLLLSALASGIIIGAGLNKLVSQKNNTPNHGLESTGAPPAAGTPETHP